MTEQEQRQQKSNNQKSSNQRSRKSRNQQKNQKNNKNQKSQNNQNNTKSQKHQKNRRQQKNQKPQPPKQIRKRHKISDHFSRKDFYCEVNNDGFRISAGLIGALEELRSIINKRINIVKGFESIESAEKTGKVKRNFHTIGVAADIQVDDISVEDVFKAAEQVETFKGIGINFDTNVIHVDTRKADQRLLWVEEAENEIYITDENRSEYFSS